MKTKILIASIVLATALLNWTPAIGKILLIKSVEGVPLDSILHSVYYFSIALIIGNIPIIRRKYPFSAFLLLFIFSLSIEIIQALIPGRTFSMSDIASNFLGIFVAYLLQRIIRTTGVQAS